MSAVLTSLRDGTFEIRLNRPEARNAFDGEVLAGLEAAAEAASKAGDARVVLLAAEGSAFCAGADVAWMRSQGEASREENERAALRLAALYEAIEGLGLPVVARVQGPAAGGGVGLVAACDVAVAASGATFALPEVRLGILPAVVSPFVARKVGLAWTRDLMLTGRKVDAAEALRIGLVHRVADAADLDAAVVQVLRDLVAGGPQALARLKRLLGDLPALLAADRAALAARTTREIAEARAGAEGRAGLRAFLDKRPPPWIGGAAP